MGRHFQADGGSWGLTLSTITAARFSAIYKGFVYIRDEQVESASLIARLSAMHAGGGDAVVYVRAYKTIPYGEVMDLLGRLSSSGYQRISLLSQTPQNDAVEATPQPAISSARTAQ